MSVRKGDQRLPSQETNSSIAGCYRQMRFERDQNRKTVHKPSGMLMIKIYGPKKSTMISGHEEQ
jgi:hypothetical protein